MYNLDGELIVRYRNRNRLGIIIDMKTNSTILYSKGWIIESEKHFSFQQNTLAFRLFFHNKSPEIKMLSNQFVQTSIFKSILFPMQYFHRSLVHW